MARQENASYEGQGQRSSKQITALDVYPVGAIFLTMDARNPAEYFGGTWELLAPGRTLVCVDTGQEAFNTPAKTGGAYGANYTHAHATQDHVLTENEMPAHYHGFDYNSLAVAGVPLPTTFDTPSSGQGFQNGANTWWNGWYKGVFNATQYRGGNLGHNHGNVTDTTQYISALQPFMTCYMWKRTA